MQTQRKAHRSGLVLLTLGIGGALFLMLFGSMRSVGARVSGQTTSTGDTMTFRLDWRATDLDHTTSVAWGDIDNDGDLDLAVGNWDKPNKIYLNSRGRLEKKATWIAPAAEGTTSLAWGDVDGDGDLDLAVGNTNASNRIYLNQSGQLMANPVWTAPITEQTTSVAWGDVDGDGRLDLAVGNYGTPNKIYVNQDDDFSLALAWTAPITESTSSVAWGDMDGDGRLDLAVGNEGMPSKVYLNIGGRLDAAPAWKTEKTQATAVAWGDVNSDGDLDLVVGERASLGGLGVVHLISVYQNDGKRLEANSTQTLNGGLSLALGDMDNDGDLDLVTSDLVGVMVYVNQDVGLSENGVVITTRTETGDDLALGDVDGDGDLDLAVGTDSTGNTVYLNPVGGLHAGRSVELPGLISRLAWADVNGDDRLDLTATQGGPILMFRGSGKAVELTPTVVISKTDNVELLAWVDANGDGILDLGTEMGAEIDCEDASGDCLAWGDLDNDGDLDLAVANRSHPVRVYLNEGGTSLATGWQASVVDDTYSLAWGDVDGDGDLDLAVGNYLAPNKVYYNHNGVLETTASWVSAIVHATTSIAWGDINDDGALDLAAGSLVFPVVVYLNRNGTLESMPSWESEDSHSTYGVDLRDVDGDGDLDLTAVAGIFKTLQPDAIYTPSFSRIYLNQGAGLLHTAAWTEPTGLAWDLAWGDGDGDGDPDLAIAAGGISKLYENQQAAHLLYPWKNGALQRPTAIVVSLYSDSVTMFSGSVTTALAPADLYAVPAVREGVIPITYTLYHPGREPMGRVRAFYSLNGGGHWQEAVAATQTITTELATLATLPYPQREITNTHVYYWDVSASGFFGQSDNVVVRLVAYPSFRPRPNSIPGPFQRPFVSTLTYPFRVRGNQVQVIGATLPISNAVVYRTPSGPTQPATLIGVAGEPFRTAPTGLLPGRGELKEGDRLTALYPTDVISAHTPTRLYFSQDDQLPLAITGTQTAELSLLITDTRRFADLDVLLDITHTVGSDLRAVLIAPDGKETALFTSTATLGNELLALAFDDEAPGIFGRDPFTATARPTEPLTPLNGSLLNGAWRLRLENRGQGAASTINGWGLALKVSDLFYTSAQPTIEGLAMYTMTAGGVQPLTVSSTNPLLLFDLDVALEWDARNDDKYLSHLRFDLRRASEFLYDWTNGQVALGRIRVFHDAKRNTFPGYGDPWGEADVRIYATNRLRPNATQGGIVTEPHTDTMKPDRAEMFDVYTPGQVAMGAVWNRFGDSSGNLGEDWARTLAHELGHYLLFLDDNYLGMNDKGMLVTVDDCPGAMADHYRDDVEKANGVDKHYGEFTVADDFRNITQCQETLSAQRTGRSDWETIRYFYPALYAPKRANPRDDEGPNTQPLDLTQVDFVDPISPTATLVAPVISLKYGGRALAQTANARAFLFKADNEWLVDLGRPQLDQVVARGMEAGDRLCVFDAIQKRIGCNEITSTLTPVLPRADIPVDGLRGTGTSRPWLPQVRVLPAGDAEVRVVVTGVDAKELQARLFPQDFPASASKHLERSTVPGDSPAFSTTFPLTATSTSGYVHVWAGSTPDGLREIVTDYALGGWPSFGDESTSLARMRALSIAKMRALSLAKMRSLSIAKLRALSIAKMRALSLGKIRSYASAMSSDGQVILFGDNLNFKEGQYVALQAATLPPDIPLWDSLVGQAYWLEASDPNQDLRQASISFGYLGSDVPAGEETGLRIHFWNESAQDWKELPTELDLYNNYASAQLQGAGLYALMSNIEIPLRRGWNLIGYPVQTAGVPAASRPITEVVRSINDDFSIIYGYDATDTRDPWKLYTTEQDAPNDLAALDFGRGYWINITAIQPITLHLRGSFPSSELQEMAASPVPLSWTTSLRPPMTFYGQVTSNGTYVPSAGVPVLAVIEGTVCGRGQTRADTDGIAYDVTVEATSLLGIDRCGRAGKQVVFFVDGRKLSPPAKWNDLGVQRHNLAAASD